MTGISGPEAYRVLAAAAADFDRVSALLGAERTARLAASLRAWREARDEAGDERQAGAAARIVRPLLGDEGRFAGGTAGEAPGVQGFQAEDLAVLLLDGHRMVGPLLGQVRERLLAAPAREAREGDERDADEALIRLPGPGGRPRLPLFQFERPEATGAPRPVVLTVNRLLDAARDPWAAADWWLAPNAWLGAPGAAPVPPERLLGTPTEAQLPNLARYLTDEEGQ